MHAYNKGFLQVHSLWMNEASILWVFSIIFKGLYYFNKLRTIIFKCSYHNNELWIKIYILLTSELAIQEWSCLFHKLGNNAASSNRPLPQKSRKWDHQADHFAFALKALVALWHVKSKGKKCIRIHLKSVFRNQALHNDFTFF